MFELNKSRQQIYRLINIYYAECEKGFIHENREKKPYNKKTHLIIEKLKKLYLDEYYYFNFQAFYDELMENKKYKGKYDISYSSLYKEFLNDDIISPIAHKGTIKLYNKKWKMQLTTKKKSKKNKNR